VATIGASRKPTRLTAPLPPRYTLRSVSSPVTPEPSVVAPGNHDGVHLGHRALIAAARSRAATDRLRTVAMFFDPHPSEVLSHGASPMALTTADRRRELLVDAGCDSVVIQPFDAAFASLSPEDFTSQILVSRLGARAVVVGPDFRFGHRRAGDLGSLRALGAVHGFDVVTVRPVIVGGERVSSTRVRELLSAGDAAAAAELLGRVHDVSGTVEKGDGRGRSLGYPTANLRCDPVALPADGVYAVVARVPGTGIVGGVANIGVRPTFDAGRAVEVHLLDESQTLYGARLRIGFVERLRPERRFDDVEALKTQIAQDVAQARAALDSAERERWAWI